MPSHRLLTAAIVPLLLVLSPLAAVADAAGAVKVADPYARAVPPGQPNSAVFMTLTNEGGSDRALVAASSTAADVVELHTHRMVDGMMQMVQIDRIDLPPGTPVELKPGGLHVMLIGLEAPLTPGEVVPVTLMLEDGTAIEVQAPVRSLAAPMQDHGHGGH